MTFFCLRPFVNPGPGGEPDHNLNEEFFLWIFLSLHKYTILELLGLGGGLHSLSALACKIGRGKNSEAKEGIQETPLYSGGDQLTRHENK